MCVPCSLRLVRFWQSLMMKCCGGQSQCREMCPAVHAATVDYVALNAKLEAERADAGASGSAPSPGEGPSAAAS